MLVVCVGVVYELGTYDQLEIAGAHGTPPTTVVEHHEARVLTVSPWGEQTRRHENVWSLGTNAQGLVTWGVCRP